MILTVGARFVATCRLHKLVLELTAFQTYYCSAPPPLFPVRPSLKPLAPSIVPLRALFMNHIPVHIHRHSERICHGILRICKEIMMQSSSLFRSKRPNIAQIFPTGVTFNAFRDRPLVIYIGIFV